MEPESPSQNALFLFQDTTENFLEEGRLMVPSALYVSQDSETMCLAFEVFPCLLEQAAIQVLTDNATAMFCKDWSFVPVEHLTFWLPSSVMRPNICYTSSPVQAYDGLL